MRCEAISRPWLVCSPLDQAQSTQLADVVDFTLMAEDIFVVPHCIADSDCYDVHNSLCNCPARTISAGQCPPGGCVEGGSNYPACLDCFGTCSASFRCEFASGTAAYPSAPARRGGGEFEMSAGNCAGNS